MPARAPASIDMLQTVIRSSMLKRADRLAGVLDAVAGAAVGGDLADQVEDQVLGGHAAAQPAVDADLQRLGLGTAAASAWPARARLRWCRCRRPSAPNAPCVAVWLSPQTMVMPGCVSPIRARSRARFPAWRSSRSYRRMPNSRQLSRSVSICCLEMGSGIGKRAIGGGHVVVGGGHGPLWPAHLAAGQPQPLERLGTGHLVDQLQIDVQDRLFPASAWTTWSSQIFSNIVRGELDAAMGVRSKLKVAGHQRINTNYTPSPVRPPAVQRPGCPARPVRPLTRLSDSPSFATRMNLPLTMIRGNSTIRNPSSFTR